MAIVSVPRNVRSSGKVTVKETPIEVEKLIEDARRWGRQIIVIHEVTDTGSDKEFRVKWSLCQAVEEDPANSFDQR